MPENLWPTFATTGRKSVKTILMDYGSGIAERTEDKIRFQVETELNDDGKLKHYCSLVVRIVPYQYPFMTVTNRSDRMFPVQIQSDAARPAIEAGSEVELVDALKKIFSDPNTVTTINQLLDAADQ